MEYLSRLPSIEHYRQLAHALYNEHMPDGLHINKLSLDELKNIIKQFPDKVIIAVINQLSKYKFYIAPNTYVNELTLRQYFESKYNIFYNSIEYPHSNPPINIKYIKCFGGGVLKGSKSNDFRLLPRDHFELWLKLLEKDYVAGSRTFAKYKEIYTEEYNFAKNMRNLYIDDDYTLPPHKLLQQYWQKNMKQQLIDMKQQLIDKNEEIKKLKEYIRNAKI